MRLAGHHDIEAPIVAAFAELVNFDQWERSALRRGAEVARLDQLAAPGKDMAWQAKYRYRGKDRQSQLQVERLEAPGKLDLVFQSAPVEALVFFDLHEQAARRTRLHVAIEVKPKTLTARLYIQSLRLAKARVDRQFQLRLGQFVKDLEERLRRS